MIRSKRNGYWIAAALILVNAVLVVALSEGPLSQAAIFVLLWIWPAITFSALIDGHIIERFLLSAGFGILLNSLLLYVYTFILGAEGNLPYLVIVSAVAIGPLVAAQLTGGPIVITRVQYQAKWSLLVLILLASLAFRLINMGYKELQGDEGVVMVRAASVLTGDSAELLVHQKGPLEILTPMAPWLLGGAIEDFWARLPFVWAGMLVVVALYWLARSWFSESVGLIAALLFAVNGFGIAFSRIIQYQSLVILFGCLALIAAWRYKKRGGGRWSMILTAAFLAGGLLAHYDAVLVAPAVIWIVVGGIREEEKFDYWGWIGAALAGMLILALFYVPYLLGPSFQDTFSYLLNDRLGSGQSGGFPRWSGFEVWRMSTFYNSLWYVLGLIILILFAFWDLVKRRLNFAAVLYFAVPLLFYLFLVQDPRTHVYTFFPGAVILAGLGAFASWKKVESFNRKVLSGSLIVIFSIWLAVSALYSYLMLVDSYPERQRTWAENRPLPALYPAAWDEPPQFGLFGFPHQAGWRAVGELTNSNYFPYGSNEEEEITNWYLAQADRTYCEDYSTFFLAENAQDEIPYDPQVVEELDSIGIVTVGGRESINIYQQSGVEPFKTLDASEHRRWLTPQEVAPPVVKGENVLDVELGDILRLLGYDLDQSRAEPGGRLVVTLYWEALKTIDRNYQVFVHLYDGTMRAQHDGAPECVMNPTTRWEPGQIIVDPHILDIREELPGTPVPLYVGMYDLITVQNLEVIGTDDGRIYLTDITIDG